MANNSLQAISTPPYVFINKDLLDNILVYNHVLAVAVVELQSWIVVKETVWSKKLQNICYLVF